MSLYLGSGGRLEDQHEPDDSYDEITYDPDLPPGTSPLSKLDLGPFEVHSMV